MDRQVIEEKLEALRYCVRRIASKCPQDGERLERDANLQDIIAMNLARSVQLSVDIAAHILADSGAPVPNTMAEAVFEAGRRQGSAPAGGRLAAAAARSGSVSGALRNAKGGIRREPGSATAVSRACP